MIIKKSPVDIKHDDYGPFKIITLTKGFYTKVSPEDYNDITQYNWYARKSHSRWYAMRRMVRYGHEIWIRMHRYIAKTPRGKLTHHKNRNSLDNRRRNLQNMSTLEHRLEHMSKFV